MYRALIYLFLWIVHCTTQVTCIYDHRAIEQFNDSTLLLLHNIAFPKNTKPVEFEREETLYLAVQEDSFAVHKSMLHHLRTDLHGMSLLCSNPEIVKSGVSTSRLGKSGTVYEMRVTAVNQSSNTPNNDLCTKLNVALRKPVVPPSTSSRRSCTSCNANLPQAVDMAKAYISSTFATKSSSGSPMYQISSHLKLKYDTLVAHLTNQEEVEINLNFQVMLLSTTKFEETNYKVTLFVPSSTVLHKHIFTLDVQQHDAQTHRLEITSMYDELSVTSHMLLNPRNEILANSITVMTYNAWNFQRGHNWTVRVGMLADIISQVDPDMLGVQELRDEWNDNLTHQAFDMAAHLPQYAFWHYEPGHIYPHADEGIAIFSKYPFNWTVHSLPISGQDHNHRIIMQSRTLSTIGKFDFFCTHWSFDRGAQISEAMETCNFTARFDSDVQVILGDLNTYSDYLLPVEYLSDACNFSDAWYSIHPNETFLTFSTMNLSTPADHIVLKNMNPTLQLQIKETAIVGGQSVDGIYPSDHYGLYSRLYISPATASTTSAISTTSTTGTTSNTTSAINTMTTTSTSTTYLPNENPSVNPQTANSHSTDPMWVPIFTMVVGAFTMLCIIAVAVFYVKRAWSGLYSQGRMSNQAVGYIFERFCRTLGYDGWHEFKLKLAQGLALALPGATDQPAQDDLASDLVNKICSRSINTLLDLRNNLNPEIVQKALDILSRANKIEFYGQGTSGFVAADAQHKFFRSGVPTVAYTDPAIHSIAAALVREGDCVVAISQRGNNPALVRSAKLARRSGADLIVLAPSGTPLADMATVLIPIDLVFNIDPYTPISARLAYLVVIDILAVGLALQRGPEFRKKMQNAQKALQEFDMQFDSFIG